MPASSSFRIDKGTLSNIMKPKTIPTAPAMQNPAEKDIMKYLLKESKKEALANYLPTKQKSSRSKQVDKRQPPPPPVDVTKPKPPTTNKGIVKEDLISKILKYQRNKRFGTIINKELGFKYTRAQLTKQSIDNLETILHRIRTHLNTRNMDQVFEHMAKVTAKGYEDLVTGFGYNIEGFSDLLLENPAFHDAFERWKIEREIPDIPPSFQLMYVIASTTYIAHLSNKHRRPQSETIEPQSKKIDKKEIDNRDDDTRLKTKFKPGEIII